MVEEARVPLLASQDSEYGELDDEFDVKFAGKNGQPRSRPGATEPALGRNSHLSGAGNGTGGGGKGLWRGESEQSVLTRPKKKKEQYSGSEMMVAVFVVAFDTKKGQPDTLSHTCMLICRECTRS